MKIKTEIEFLTFNDGIVTLYQTDENDEIKSSSGKAHCFGSEKVGVTRYYQARQNDIELDKVIHIHMSKEVTTDYAAVINGTRYKIEQVQQEMNSNPRSTVLSLSQRGLWIGGAADDL